MIEYILRSDQSDRIYKLFLNGAAKSNDKNPPSLVGIYEFWNGALGIL